MKTCIACGMPLVNPEDFPNGDQRFDACVHCSDESGKLKTCEEIFQGGVFFFMTVMDGDRELAERMTRKNMNSLPYWKEHQHDCLQGPQATDEEFRKMMESFS